MNWHSACTVYQHLFYSCPKKLMKHGLKIRIASTDTLNGYCPIFLTFTVNAWKSSSFI